MTCGQSSVGQVRLILWINKTLFRLQPHGSDEFQPAVAIYKQDLSFSVCAVTSDWKQIDRSSFSLFTWHEHILTVCQRVSFSFVWKRPIFHNCFCCSVQFCQLAQSKGGHAVLKLVCFYVYSAWSEQKQWMVIEVGFFFFQIIFVNALH